MKRVMTIAGVAGLACVAAGQETGPSSSARPYVLPSLGGVKTVSVLTVGDSVNTRPDGSAYRLVGIPDGMGAFDNGDGTFTLLCNHELGVSAGIVRDHGGTGAFVSRWIINKSDLSVVRGEDLIKRAFDLDPVTRTFVENPARRFGRFCSGDLPAATAWFNSATGLGSTARIYMNGEEIGSEGEAFAHVVDGPEAGRSYELAYLGRFSWENSVPCPAEQDTTIVAGFDDSGRGQTYFWVGTKQASGLEVEKAGLKDGSLFGLRVAGLDNEQDIAGGVITAGQSWSFDLADLGDVTGMTGVQLEAMSDAAGVDEWARPEDGHWNPNDPSQCVWVTTGAGSAPGRAWLVDFDDISNPAAGGTFTLLLDGSEGAVSLDNLTWDTFGNVVIQEDPGSSSRLAKIWSYSTGTGVLTEIAAHNGDFFIAGAAEFLTTNEESSGVIEMRDILGEGWTMINVQAHFGIPGELVEGGQILAMFSPLSTSNPPCNRADFAAEFGVLNVNDIIEFVNAFNAGGPTADIAPSAGDDLLNTNDVIDFVNAFNAGCGG